MKYQLVLQFPASDLSDFDAIIKLEESLISVLGKGHVVDGHDFGSGEMNIFIHTNRPAEAFNRCLTSIPDDFNSSLKAAFRDLSSEDYHWLYPENDSGVFKIS